MHQTKLYYIGECIIDKIRLTINNDTFIGLNISKFSIRGDKILYLNVI